jgi:hypothetical protein
VEFLANLALEMAWMLEKAKRKSSNLDYKMEIFVAANGRNVWNTAIPISESHGIYHEGYKGVSLFPSCYCRTVDQKSGTTTFYWFHLMDIAKLWIKSESKRHPDKSTKIIGPYWIPYDKDDRYQ